MNLPDEMIDRWGCLSPSTARLLVDCCRLAQVEDPTMTKPFRLSIDRLSYLIADATFCAARKSLIATGFLKRELNDGTGNPVRQWVRLVWGAE